MGDKPIFDSEYDQPTATEASPSAKEESQQEGGDAGLLQDLHDPGKLYDTERPRRITKEWPISNG
jgi:hypothetical protein